MRVEPGGFLRGELTPPGDKSISHRYALLGAMAEGRTVIENYSPSDDCAAMLDCLRQLGAEIAVDGDTVCVSSRGWREWTAPAQTLNTRNSGTALRLLAGPLSGLFFPSRLEGDQSLNSRPMGRIVTPLTRMGAHITSQGGRPPLEISGRQLTGIEHHPPQASAQVKSCLLLAGLTARGRTTITERHQTRDHTERALAGFGVDLSSSSRQHSLVGPASLEATSMTIPGDVSAAVYFLVPALLMPSSEVVLRNVGCNATRNGLLELLEAAGAAVTRENLTQIHGEPVCDLRVRSGSGFLQQLPSEISARQIPNLIDELPLLSVLCAIGSNGLNLRSAEELRYKETDRIRAVVLNLRRLGIEVVEHPDGLTVAGRQSFGGGSVETLGDHRIAMAFAVAGLLSEEGVTLDDPDCVAVSHPNFFEDLGSLRRAG